MKKHTVLAAVATVLCLVACGVQTTDDDSNDPNSGDPVEFGGVGQGHQQPGADAAPGNNNGGPANSGSTQNDSGSPQPGCGCPVYDGGNNATDSGSPVVDSGANTVPCDAGTMTDAGSPDSSTDSGTTDSGSDAGVADSGSADSSTDSGIADAGTDSGSVDSGLVDSGVVVPENADVVRLSNNGKTLLLSTRYIFSANCGEVRGPMPGVGWSSGPKSCDTDNDGYFAYTPISGTVGTYAFTYLDSSKPADGWALYGNIDLLRAMSPVARSFVECNWWDASTQKTVSVGSPSCSLKASFGANGTLAGAGNMTNLL